MNLKLIIYIVLLCLFIGCSGNKSNEDSIILSEPDYTAYQKCINNYYMYNDTSQLDSALYIIDVFLNDNYLSDSTRLTLQKASIFVIQNRFVEAIEIIDRIKYQVMENFPIYNDIVLLRFKAMEAQYNENYMLRDQYINEIIVLINTYIINNERQVSQLYYYDNLEEILSDQSCFILVEYYYYLSFVLDDYEYRLIFDSLKAVDNVNEEFVDFLKNENDNFMYFSGF